MANDGRGQLPGGLQRLDLSTFRGGAIAERFALELERVVENIQDPNTEPTKTRKIEVSLTFRPDESREFAETSLRVTSRLAPLRDVGELTFFGRSGGEFVAVRRDPAQLELPSGSGEASDDAVLPITRNATGRGS